MATNTTRTVTVPPFEHWVSPSLLTLINNSPTNPDLRGLVRRELNIVLPRDGELTTERIKQVLTDKFTTSRPWTAHLKADFDAGYQLRNLYSSTNRAPDPEAPAPQNARARNARPAVQVEQDGSFVLPGVTLTGIERGTATFENTISYSGTRRIPGEIARQGADAIRAWLRDNRNGMEENTENYLYDNFTTSAVEIETVALDEQVLNEALRQLSERPQQGVATQAGGATAGR